MSDGLKSSCATDEQTNCRKGILPSYNKAAGGMIGAAHLTLGLVTFLTIAAASAIQPSYRTWSLFLPCIWTISGATGIASVWYNRRVLITVFGHFNIHCGAQMLGLLIPTAINFHTDELMAIDIILIGLCVMQIPVSIAGVYIVFKCIGCSCKKRGNKSCDGATENYTPTQDAEKSGLPSNYTTNYNAP